VYVYDIYIYMCVCVCVCVFVCVCVMQKFGWQSHCDRPLGRPVCSWVVVFS